MRQTALWLLLGLLIAVLGCPVFMGSNGRTDHTAQNGSNGDTNQTPDGADGEPGPTICASNANVVRIFGDLPGDFRSYGPGAFGHRVDVMDFDGDGLDDLVVCDRNGMYARIYRGPITSDLLHSDAFVVLDFMDLYFMQTDPVAR